MPQVQSWGAFPRDPAFPPSSRLLGDLYPREAAPRSDAGFWFWGSRHHPRLGSCTDTGTRPLSCEAEAGFQPPAPALGGPWSGRPGPDSGLPPSLLSPVSPHRDQSISQRRPHVQLPLPGQAGQRAPRNGMFSPPASCPVAGSLEPQDAVRKQDQVRGEARVLGAGQPGAPVSTCCAPGPREPLRVLWEAGDAACCLLVSVGPDAGLSGAPARSRYRPRGRPARSRRAGWASVTPRPARPRPFPGPQCPDRAQRVLAQAADRVPSSLGGSVLIGGAEPGGSRVGPALTAPVVTGGGQRLWDPVLS